MSLIITVYTSEGIVMASDSRTTQSIKNRGEIKSYPLSDNANKTFLTKWNYGISTCGAASINGLPISGYILKFLNSFQYTPNITVESFSNDLCDYFLKLALDNDLIFHVAGYDEEDKTFTQKVFKCVIFINNGKKEKSIIEQSNNNYGSLWDGQSEVMSRLTQQQFLSPKFISSKKVTYIDEAGNLNDIEDVFVIPHQGTDFFARAQIDFAMMNNQDAIDFARFAIRTTIDTQRFLQKEKTVGGPIDVLLIKPQDAVWISNKELK